MGIIPSTFAKDKFEGNWLDSSNEATGPKLKWVRANP